MSCSSQDVYREFPSPDGKYRIVVYRKSQWLSTMPGQASDAPGIVKLVDSKGEVLEQAEVPAVQQVDAVEWEEKVVRIKLVAEWRLPGAE